MIVYTEVPSPVGELLLVGAMSGAGDMTLTSLTMPGHRSRPVVDLVWRQAPELFGDVIDQLRAYFAGDLTRFDIALTPGGTAFQRRVWDALDDIPFGATTTYGALAEQLDLPRERIQALGAAVGANPLLLVRPCHRVIGADGGMRGYAAGVERKVQLLTHEGALPPALL